MLSEGSLREYPIILFKRDHDRLKELGVVRYTSRRVLLAPTRGSFFLAVFFRVTHDGLSQRGTTRSQRLGLFGRLLFEQTESRKTMKSFFLLFVHDQTETKLNHRNNYPYNSQR